MSTAEEEDAGFYEDKSVGVLLGAMAGDILGAAPEGEHLSQAQIRERWGAAEVDSEHCVPSLRDFVAGMPLGLIPSEHSPRTGCYTDDTNCTLALTTSLVRCGGLDANDAARSYTGFWLAEPERGYPDSAKLVLMAAKEGIDINVTGRVAFSNGSFVNGAAMRIAPI